MKFSDVLSKYGKEKRRLIYAKLSDLGNKLFDKDRWQFIESNDSETVGSYKGDYYSVFIAQKPLTDDYNNIEWNKAGYIRAVKDIFHEKRHVWQYTEAQNNRTRMESIKDDGRMTNIVRRTFVGNHFPSVYCNNYENDISEIDAERYGLICTLNYFKNDPIINEKEARDILFDIMMADDNPYENIIKKYKTDLHSIDDVVKLFTERRDKVIDIKYSITERITPEFFVTDNELKLTREFLYSDKFKKLRDKFNNCKTGREQDIIMEQAIIIAHPDIIRKSPLRLRTELLDLKHKIDLNNETELFIKEVLRISIPTNNREKL